MFTFNKPQNMIMINTNLNLNLNNNNNYSCNNQQNQLVFANQLITLNWNSLIIALQEVLFAKLLQKRRTIYGLLKLLEFCLMILQLIIRSACQKIDLFLLFAMMLMIIFEVCKLGQLKQKCC